MTDTYGRSYWQGKQGKLHRLIRAPITPGTHAGHGSYYVGNVMACGAILDVECASRIELSRDEAQDNPFVCKSCKKV